jgi:hypothetical protein
MTCTDVRNSQGGFGRKKRVALFWIWDTELAANLASEKIRDFRMSGHCGHSAGIGKIYVFAMLRAFVGENASEPLQVSNELSPFHLYLELLDDDLSLGKFRQIYRLSDHFDGINQIFAGLFQGRALCERARNIICPSNPPFSILHKTGLDLHK